MYDTETFEIVCVAPAYDFNMAFETGFDYEDTEPFILSHIHDFIKNNQDILELFDKVEQYLNTDIYLLKEEKNRILEKLKTLKTPMHN